MGPSDLGNFPFNVTIISPIFDVISCKSSGLAQLWYMQNFQVHRHQMNNRLLLLSTPGTKMWFTTVVIFLSQCFVVVF